MPKFTFDQLATLTTIAGIGSVVMSIGVGILADSGAAGCITFGTLAFAVGGFLAYQFAKK